MITQEKIEEIKNRLVKTYKPATIYLFGSHAWGTPDSSSDIDLCIVVNKSDEKKYKRAVKGIIALSGLQIAKDIVVYTKEEFNELTKDISTLCYKVKNEGVILYEAI